MSREHLETQRETKQEIITLVVVVGGNKMIQGIKMKTQSET